jgi:virulence-associated protein VapD
MNYSSKYTLDFVKEYIDKFNYKLLSNEYKNTTTKLSIQCDKGHIYEQTFSWFMHGNRCPKCARENRKLSYEYVKHQIEQCEYILLSTEYHHVREKLHMICNEGHECYISASDFINTGHRCRICSTKKSANSRRHSYQYIKTYIESFGYKLLSDNYENYKSKLFIECEHGHQYYVTYTDFQTGSRCIKCHHENCKNSYEDVKTYINNFGYQLISKEYINVNTKLEMVCPAGHQYFARFDNFKSGFRCPICSYKINGENSKYSYQEVKDYIESFGGYKLLSDDYIDCKTKLKIQCNQGHIFETTFDRFKNYGFYCPICNESNGEQIVRNYLQNNQFNFCGQYRINNCRNILPLPFDFAIFDNYNKLFCLIEYDGKQHYEMNCDFGGEDEFEALQYRDSIKTNYCINHNIPLLRIPYWDFKNIKSILDSYFFMLKNNQITSQQEIQQEQNILQSLEKVS